MLGNGKQNKSSAFILDWLCLVTPIPFSEKNVVVQQFISIASRDYLCLLEINLTTAQDPYVFMCLST